MAIWSPVVRDTKGRPGCVSGGSPPVRGFYVTVEPWAWDSEEGEWILGRTGWSVGMISQLCSLDIVGRLMAKSWRCIYNGAEDGRAGGGLPSRGKPRGLRQGDTQYNTEVAHCELNMVDEGLEIEGHTGGKWLEKAPVILLFLYYFNIMLASKLEQTAMTCEIVELPFIVRVTPLD